ncbi:MAG TPA: caspase family protein, partial [Thermoanaerobaculia bacterium]|nr:caspase family protein [Thermoanaerobaculia bacterium]
MIPITDRPVLHALLVGIDAYPQPPDSAGTAVPSLRGCVRDVERLRDHLALAGVPASRIVTLTAAAATDSPPPTRQALLDALFALLDRAAPGEQVLIHYSGHGTRLATAFGDDKRGGTTHDEALVPWDAPSGAALLRDVELAFRLKRFVEKEVFVTLVLYCCHSGGAVMRSGVDERIARSLEGAVRPLGDGLASREELIEAWRWWWEPPSDPDAPRDWQPNWVTGDSGWLPLPRGYALLAACTHDQLAHEIDPGDGGRTGLLTHSLLQVLEAAPATLTYKQLYERLCSAFAASGKTQTPQVEGEIERQLFGGALRPTAWALRVVARQGAELVLDGGVAHGLRVGARVRVRDPAEPGLELAAVLDRVGAVDSTASIVLDRTAQPEEPGANVGPGAEVLIDDPGDPSLTVAVALRFTGLGAAGREALQAVGSAAAAQGSAFLRAAGSGERADVVVTVADAHFVVLDANDTPLVMEPRLAA